MINAVGRIATLLTIALFSVPVWAADPPNPAPEHIEEAPLEDVWPALSEERLGDLDAMVERGEIRLKF